MKKYFVSFAPHVIGSVWQIQNIQVVLAEEGKALLSFQHSHGADENKRLTSHARCRNSVFRQKGGLKIIISHSGMSSVRKSASIVSSVLGYLSCLITVYPGPALNRCRIFW